MIIEHADTTVDDLHQEHPLGTEYKAIQFELYSHFCRYSQMECCKEIGKGPIHDLSAVQQRDHLLYEVFRSFSFSSQTRCTILVYNFSDRWTVLCSNL